MFQYARLATSRSVGLFATTIGLCLLTFWIFLPNMWFFVCSLLFMAFSSGMAFFSRLPNSSHRESTDHICDENISSNLTNLGQMPSDTALKHVSSEKKDHFILRLNSQVDRLSRSLALANEKIETFQQQLEINETMLSREKMTSERKIADLLEQLTDSKQVFKTTELKLHAKSAELDDALKINEQHTQATETLLEEVNANVRALEQERDSMVRKNEQLSTTIDRLQSEHDQEQQLAMSKQTHLQFLWEEEAETRKIAEERAVTYFDRILQTQQVLEGQTETIYLLQQEQQLAAAMQTRLQSSWEEEVETRRIVEERAVTYFDRILQMQQVLEGQTEMIQRLNIEVKSLKVELEAEQRTNTNFRVQLEHLKQVESQLEQLKDQFDSHKYRVASQQGQLVRKHQEEMETLRERQSRIIETLSAEINQNRDTISNLTTRLEEARATRIGASMMECQN